MLDLTPFKTNQNKDENIAKKILRFFSIPKNFKIIMHLLKNLKLCKFLTEFVHFPHFLLSKFTY